jgi:hypothetical protein
VCTTDVKSLPSSLRRQLTLDLAHLLQQIICLMLEPQPIHRAERGQQRAADCLELLPQRPDT